MKPPNGRDPDPAAAESGNTLRDVIDSLPDPTFAIDTRGRVTLWNHAMEDFTRVPSGQMLGRTDHEYSLPFYGERRPLLIDVCTQPDEVVSRYYPGFTRAGTVLAAECRLPGPARPGAYVWFTARPLRDRRGAVVGAVESIRDVSDRKQVEETFATVFRLSPDVLTISTLEEGRYVAASDRFYSISGYSPGEVIGHTAGELGIWADDGERDRVASRLRQVGSVTNEEIRFRMRSGEVHFFLFSAGTIEIRSVRHLLAVSVDINDRKAEQETIRRQNRELAASNQELVRSRTELVEAARLLTRSEEKASTAFHLAPVVMSLSRVSDGMYVDVSDRFLTLVGYTRDEVIGHTSSELGIFESRADRDHIAQTMLAGGRVTDAEVVLRDRAGVRHIVLLSCAIIGAADDPHLVTVGVDVTEQRREDQHRKLLEEQLRQAQKMESVGRLAGGVAHDFNNMLTAILGNAELILDRLHDHEGVRALANDITRAATSAAQLTRHLLAFSRKEIIRPTVLDVNALVENTQKMLARLIGENIRLVIATRASGRIKADAGHLEQAIINVTINARDAMPEGGTLVIETDDVVLDPADYRAREGRAPGPYVLIALSDTGHGMSEETRRNIFEPFFTTKEQGKGTGLGLAVVYGAVAQNGGFVEVHSVLGQGSTFNIYLPCTSERRDEDAGATAVEPTPGGQETILLVEDERLVREFARQVLARLGYRVIPCASGEEALALAESHLEPVQLLLTDVILPGMNGRALAEMLTARRPDLRVLYASGYSAELIAERGVIEKGINFIGKPYGSAALARKVRQILDGTRVG